jgi:integrase
MVEADLARGAWVDPRAGRVTLAEYSRRWLALRTDLRPRTRELYASLLKLHIRPVLGTVEIARITPSMVRSWYAELSGDDGPGRATAARCYRLLRTIMNTAVTDELMVKNPCQVKGVGAERSPERPVITVLQAQALAEVIAPRFRAAVLLASYCSMRRGEILALRRGDVDLLHGTLTVRRAVVSLATGELFMGDPKTAAGRRTIAIPDVIVPSLEDHLTSHVAAPPDSLLFTVRRVVRSVHTFFRRRGTRRADRPGSSICTFTICATAATPGRRPPARARRSSWPGWATPARQLHCGISTPPPIVIGRSPLLSARWENGRSPRCRTLPRLGAGHHERKNAADSCRWRVRRIGAPPTWCTGAPQSVGDAGDRCQRRVVLCLAQRCCV